MSSFLMQWGWAVAIAINLLLCWVVWSARHAFVSRDDHDALKERLIITETKLDQLPGHADVGDLHERINALGNEVSKLSSTVSGLEATAKALNTSVGLLNQHHMSKS